MDQVGIRNIKRTGYNEKRERERERACPLQKQTG